MADNARDVLAACWLVTETEIAREQAQQQIADVNGADHSGDCNKQPWACMRCIVDDAFAHADADLAALDAAGLAVVPKVPTEECETR